MYLRKKSLSYKISFKINFGKELRYLNCIYFIYGLKKVNIINYEYHFNECLLSSNFSPLYSFLISAYNIMDVETKSSNVVG